MKLKAKTMSQKIHPARHSCGFLSKMIVPLILFPYARESKLRALILEDDCVPAASFFPFCKALLERYADSVSVLTYPTNAERNAALANGRVELIFGSTVSHYAFLSTPQGVPFDFVGGPIDGQGLGGDVAIPLAKGREDLRKRLNAAIDSILNDGTFARINNTYFSSSVF